MGGGSKITSIIAHIDHGKTTVMDSLIAAQGHISRSLAGDLRYMDSRPDEQNRKITLKLGPVELANGHVFIDTPGHVDFESLIFCSSVLADSFIILIDVNEGITPRTYSLVKYVCRERSVLLLNKIDKAESLDQIQLVVHQMNALLGEDVFAWEKNNVILCCAALCAGLCHGMFRFGKKNTLKSAFAAYTALSAKYEEDDLQGLMEKYKVKFKNKKNIFSAVMPLHAAVFDTIDKIHQAPAGDAAGNNGLYFTTGLFEMTAPTRPLCLGITIYGIFKEKHVYTRDNVIFVARIFYGQLRKGDLLYSTANESSCTATVEHLYAFDVDRCVEIDYIAGPALVGLQGGFLKNSALSSTPITFNLRSFMTPFHMSKIVLRDLAQLPAIKDTIRAISFTEQCLRVKKNKFAELEVRCSGVVQFDKICNDLVDAGYLFETRKAWLEFCEYPTLLVEQRYSGENAEFTITIGNVKDLENLNEGPSVASEEDFWSAQQVDVRNGNVFRIKSAANAHIIESVLEIFIDSGPLIRANIMDACITIEVTRESDARFYNTLRNELTALYLKSEPGVCPRLFGLTISTERGYIDQLYVALEKNYSVVDGEDFNDDTGFSILHCRAPQPMLQNVLQEISIKTKGTAYVEVEEAGYAPIRDFSSYIEQIRSEKGLSVSKVISENPEKQRTLRK